MRGEILSFDEGSGIGLISGDDGIRYGFDRSAVQPPAAIRSGLRVDFVPENGEAVQVMLLAGAAPAFGEASLGTAPPTWVSTSPRRCSRSTAGFAAPISGWPGASCLSWACC